MGNKLLSLLVNFFSGKSPPRILSVAHQMLGLLKGIDNDKSALGERFMVGDNFIDLGLAGLLKAQHYFQ